MAQKTFTDGSVLTASDLNTYCAGEGGAWTSHTPQIDQGASTNIAKTVTYSKYARYGRMIVWNFTLDLTAGGTAGTQVTVTLPTTAAAAAGVNGSAALCDTGTSTRYVCTAFGADTSRVAFLVDQASSAAWGQSPNLAIATGDQIRGSVTYEASS